MQDQPMPKIIPIVYWLSTLLVAISNLTGIFYINKPFVQKAMQHLGLPKWFYIELIIANFIGGFIILLPFIGKRLKEWAYVGLGLGYLSAIIAHFSIDGINRITFMPLVAFVILLTSYITYHKLNEEM